MLREEYSQEPTHKSQEALLLLWDLSGENASKDGKFSPKFKPVQSSRMSPPGKAGRPRKRAGGRNINR